MHVLVSFTDADNSLPCMLAGCIQNTLTGNIDSCTNDACVCKKGFAPPNCCECVGLNNGRQSHYVDPVTNQCTRESMVFNKFLSTHKAVLHQCRIVA